MRRDFDEIKAGLQCHLESIGGGNETDHGVGLIDQANGRDPDLMVMAEVRGNGRHLGTKLALRLLATCQTETRQTRETVFGTTETGRTTRHHRGEHLWRRIPQEYPLRRNHAGGSTLETTNAAIIGKNAARIRGTFRCGYFHTKSAVCKGLSDSEMFCCCVDHLLRLINIFCFIALPLGIFSFLGFLLTLA